jgi:murein DD-endopeptidase MepM/ murein hydrolase activator NlpD
VVQVRDGLPEHTPFSQEIATTSFTPETVAGNVVVVAIGRGHFAVYAHLRPGSVSVEEGDPVRAGQEIGRIGNSGHSLAPHLHFHIQDRADPLAGEGIAFALRSFELLGRLDSLPQALRGAPWTPHPARPARTVTEELPLENMVIEIR